MDSRECSRCPAPLTQRVAEDAGSQQIADAVATMWTEVESALQPVVGRRGAAALFRRSVHMTATHHAWLISLSGGSDDGPIDVAQFRDGFAAQPPSLALDAGNVLFALLRELLISLIGPDLSERLLKAAWANTAGAAAAQGRTS